MKAQSKQSLGKNLNKKKLGRPSKPEQKCIVDGCKRYQYTTTSKGYCRLHLYRIEKYGTCDLPIKQIRLCSVDGCNDPYYKWGFCMRHSSQFKRNGYINSVNCRSPQTGQITKSGYMRTMIDNVRKLEHVRIVEKAIGKAIPKGAQIHHIDCNKLNNNPTNLVVCPDSTYHSLIEKRGRAFNASGHADWLKCVFCKNYDDPINLSKSRRYHPKCRQSKSKSKDK